MAMASHHGLFLLNHCLNFVIKKEDLMKIGLKEGFYGTYIWYMEAPNRIRILHYKTNFKDESMRKHLNSLEVELSIQDF